MAKTKPNSKPARKAQTPAKPVRLTGNGAEAPICVPFVPPDPPAVLEPWKPVYETVATVGGRLMSPAQYAALADACAELVLSDAPVDLQDAAHRFLLEELTGVPVAQDPARPTCCETGACERPVGDGQNTPEGQAALRGEAHPARPEDFGAEGEQA